MVKRYKRQFAKSYQYTNSDGTVDDICFVANGRLLPLFKSISGESLEVALAEYQVGLIELCKNGTADKLIILSSGTDAEKQELLRQNPNLLFTAFKYIGESKMYDDVGMTFIDLLITCMHICALPTDEEPEAISLGVDLLPEEILTDTTIFNELISMAFGFINDVKKK